MPYMIRNVKTGLYATQGLKWHKVGKIWQQLGHAKNALHGRLVYEGNGTSRPVSDACEIIEVNLIPVRKAPATPVLNGEACVNCGLTLKQHAGGSKCLLEHTDYKLWDPAP